MKIELIDKVIGYLLNKLKENNLLSKLNVIVTSDHGMAEMKQTIIINKYIDMKLIDSKKTLYGIVANIYPANDTVKQKLYDSLKSIENLSVYFKEDVPERLHYTRNERIGPIVVIADEGFVLSTQNQPQRGNHAFDNEIKSMRTIFLARGPDFKTNVKIDPINNVDVYPLLCDLVKVKCHAHNGTIDNFAKALKEKPSNGQAKQFKISIHAFFLALYLFLFK